MNFVSLRDRFVLLLIGFYLILNAGFMLLRFPPGSATGVPIGELILLVYATTFIFEIKWVPEFSRSVFILPFVLWWFLGVGRAILAVPEYGFWALRDATHVIESLFIWVGFIFASNGQAIDRFFLWFRRITLIATAYAFTYPFSEYLKSFSPTVQAAAGYSTTILFKYANTAVLVFVEASYLLIFSDDKNEKRNLILASLLIVLAIVAFQTRTIYLQIISLLLFFSVFHRAALGKIVIALIIGVMAFLIFSLSGVELSGRLGEPITAEFFANHFLAIAGIENDGVVGAARGVGLRLKWWSIIWRQITENAGNFFMGLGFGFPLVDYAIAFNVSIREPHNSYLSILGRMGFIGILVFTWFHFLLIRNWIQAFNLCRKVGYRLGQNRLLLIMIFFVLVWVYSLGEDAMEKPFFAIPYYFFWGVVLHYRLHLIDTFSTEEEPIDLTIEISR